MIRIERQIFIERQPREVFDFLGDVENLPKWQSGAVQSPLLSEPPMRQGSRFSETVKMGPMTVHTRCELTEFKPAEVFAFEAMSKPLDYAGSFRLTDENDEPGSRCMPLHT